MHSRIKTALACLVLAATLTACSKPATPTPSTAKHQFRTTIQLANAGAACDRDPHCWLPTQFQPRLVNGETASLRNRWPSKGNSVKVYCQTTGQRLHNTVGESSRKWYAIIIPRNKVFRAATNTNLVKGARLGYVNALWLADKQVAAPAC